MGTSLGASQGVSVEFDVSFRRVAHGRRRLTRSRTGEAPPAPVPVGTIPRVARLMALAIHFEGLIRRGEAADYAELARVGRVTRARLTQIMALLHLAPDIQEELLHLPLTTTGRDKFTEHHLRPIAAVVEWEEQRRMWQDRSRT